MKLSNIPFSAARLALTDEQIQDLIIRVGGKVFHKLLGGHRSLSLTSSRLVSSKPKVTGAGRIEKMRVELTGIEDVSIQIDKLLQAGRGVIILNHASGIFADYLPVFGLLGDAVLNSTTFFTADYSLSMNRSEFPNYSFESANPKSISDKKILLKFLRNRLKALSESSGYIFLMPAGDGKDSGDKPFQALFSHIVSDLPPDIPVLALHIDHKKGDKAEIGYTDILKSRFGLGKYSSHLRAQFTTTGDWQAQTIPLRDYYNSLFPKVKKTGV